MPWQPHLKNGESSEPKPTSLSRQLKSGVEVSTDFTSRDRLSNTIQRLKANTDLRGQHDRVIHMYELEKPQKPKPSCVFYEAGRQKSIIPVKDYARLLSSR